MNECESQGNTEKTKSQRILLPHNNLVANMEEYTYIGWCTRRMCISELFRFFNLTTNTGHWITTSYLMPMSFNMIAHGSHVSIMFNVNRLVRGTERSCCELLAYHSKFWLNAAKLITWLGTQFFFSFSIFNAGSTSQNGNEWFRYPRPRGHFDLSSIHEGSK